MARSPRQALVEHRAVLQQAASCLGAHATLSREMPGTGGGSALTLNRGEQLRLGGTLLALVFDARLVAIHQPDNGWVSRAITYRARFETRDGRELLSFHWHPAGPSHVTVPHVHARLDIDDKRLVGGRVHIPTPELSLAAIIRFAIEELGSSPARADWADVLIDPS